MRIVVAGMYRSGSTWLYNCARTICEQHGPTYGAFEASYDPSRPERFHVVKAHRYYPDLEAGSIVLKSWRDLDDILASMERCKAHSTYSNAAQPERISEYLMHFARWNCDYMMDYDRMLASPKRIIVEVAGAVGLPVHIASVYDAIRRITPPEKGVDPVTLLHAQHATDGRDIGHTDDALEAASAD